MALREISTSDQSCVRFFGAICGPSGAGKTTVASTLDPKTSLILSLESGLLSIKGSGHIVWECETIEDLEMCIEALAAGMIPFPDKNGKYSKLPDTIKNIYVDSLTEALEKIFDRAFDGYKRDKKKTLDAYNDVFVFGKALIKRLRDMTKYNFFFSALTGTEKNGMVLSPSFDLPGQKLKTKFKSYFDFCFVMTALIDDDGKKEYCFITSESDHDLAKSRATVLDAVEPADLTHIMNKVIGA